ncbi:MAG TPA: hypothetical protein VFB42_07095 [Gaiellaceae bacterium]|nr:hypothetical protein [Gaiellaceae bacterium]
MLLASLSASSLLAACGGSAGRPPEPRLARRDAAELVALARRVERDVPADGCAARREILELRALAGRLVAAGRVPAPLRSPLRAGVAALAADAPACAPPPPAAPAAPAEEEGDEGPGGRGGRDHGHGNAHGHGRAKGHGHGHGGHD